MVEKNDPRYKPSCLSWEVVVVVVVVAVEHLYPFSVNKSQR